MPPIHGYDLAFRFERALQPDGLRILQTCTAALTDAIADARHAGHDPDRDPAVVLLGRHLGRIAAGCDPEAIYAEDEDLREACKARIAAIRSTSILVPLVLRGSETTPIWSGFTRPRLAMPCAALPRRFVSAQHITTSVRIAVTPLKHPRSACLRKASA